jgi:hypothetical protein
MAAEQKRRQGVLPMTNVMRDMIAVSREHMVVFVVAFPSPSARPGDVGNVVLGNVMVASGCSSAAGAVGVAARAAGGSAARSGAEAILSHCV